jgi:hypothetical protein
MHKSKQNIFMKFLEGELRPLCFPQALSIRETAHAPDPVEFLADKINPHLFLRAKDFPEIDQNEVAAIATERILRPLKNQADSGFGNEWNRLTAISAAQTLGIPTHHLERKLKSNSPSAKTLKTRQAEVSQAWEQNCQLKAKEHSERFGAEVAKLVWVKTKLDICEKILASLPRIPRQSPSQEVIKNSAVEGLINLVNKFGEQTFDRSDFLRRVVISLAQAEELKLIALQCPSFKHESEGIIVNASAKDHIRADANGRRILISPVDDLKEVIKTADVLRSTGISVKTIVAVVDIDAFVMGNQEKALSDFCASLEEETARARFNVSITRISELTGISELESSKTQGIRDLWRMLSGRTEKIAGRLIDTEFKNLQRLNLPNEWKTREFATEVAERRFIAHFLIGRSLPQIFPEGIIMLRAQGTESSEIDKLGAKSVGKKLFVLNHWNERKIIE